MPTYIALLRKDPASDFGVDFPDFPGCVTAGKTLEEARTMAAEALDLHVEGMQEDRDPIPEHSIPSWQIGRIVKRLPSLWKSARSQPSLFVST
jgi:predicted RNase H-like HicB family nuclease